MDRTREPRRVTMAATNGLPRRRHRTGSLRDSPEDDAPVELQDTARLRDRGTGKKDRDRDRDRDRERERERDRDRDRERDRDQLSSRSKRRRGDRMMHGGSNRDDAVGGGLEESSEESVNDDEDEDDDDRGSGGGGGGAGSSSMKILPPNHPPSLSSSSFSNNHHHHHHQQLHHRKSFPLPAKVLRASPTGTAPAPAVTTATATPWKAPDEMIGVSVPRKARSASTKRSHECWASGGGGGVGVTEQIQRQTSTSPVRSSGGQAMLASASQSPAPVSPSSSNASVKKKMKPNGPKHRPPKSSSKSTSSAQDEIEFEIAEVLYGMMRQPQPQVSTKQEIMANDSSKFNSRELNNGSSNKSTGDAKSRVSSPISNPTSAVLPSSLTALINSSASAAPMFAIAPKRKRPRPVKYEDENPSIHPIRNSPISSTTKAEADQPTKTDNSSPKLEKSLGFSAENGGIPYDLSANEVVQELSIEAQPELAQPGKINFLPDLKALAEESESRDASLPKEEPPSPKKESPTPLRLDDDRDSLTATKTNSKVSEMESLREEKFQIDLMAPPPQLRSSPERDSEIDIVAVDPKPTVTDVGTAVKSTVKEDDGAAKIVKEDMNVEPEEKKAKLTVEEVESQKPMISKERNIDLQLDLEKTDKDTGTTASVTGNKLHHHHHQHVQKQHQQQQHATTEKLASAQSSSLPLPMSMAGWPGGLSPMGIMAPLQGVVSMDGTTVSPAAIPPPQLLFNQPRPKRCATHYYIARNIHYLQQVAKINPYWQAAAGSAFQFGPKAFNMNVVPPTELHASRVVNSVQDKGPGLAIFPGHPGKDKSSQAAANIVDTSQRKQVLLQQALPPGAPSNILHGPAFIFPLSQQQAAAAASVRPVTMKSPAVGSAASSSAPSSASISATAPAVSFNYPNMPGSETQYLAILQNGAYPIPIPAHVGAAPAYRGTHPQTMPFFNGSFYSSQMLHPSQLQQQPTPTQSQQIQPGHQNPSISSGSSSSQKHLQNQQQRPHGNGVNVGSGNLQGFPAPKNQPPQSVQLQQRQQSQNQNVPHQARQLESELGGEDSPSTADSRVSRANMSIYSPNLGMHLPPPNFALMTSASMVSPAGASSASNNPSEKKQQQSQSQGSKAGIESLPSQAFAMSFPSINGATTAPGLDIARHGYHFMAATAVTQAAQQKKNYRVSEDGKSGGKDASNAEEERNGMTGGKTSATAGQSITFCRPDLTETSISTMPGNNVIDSSARSLNLGSASARPSGSVMSTAISNVNSPVVQQQLQRSQQAQQQQLQLQLQKQQQFGAASARSKTPATTNGSVYSDQMAAKFPNVLSPSPQNPVQSSSSPAQSPQWKNSVRAPTSQLPSPSLASNSSSVKNLPQQQTRTQQGHTQISFAANVKPSSGLQGQPPPSSNQSPSSLMLVGSPTTSSISKSAGGSPRTASTSTSNKGVQSSSLSSQQTKGSPSLSTQKSSPVGGSNIPSILGHPHNTNSSSSSGSKSQLPQQQQQHQLPKHAVQQAQMLYTSAYMQAQHAASSANTTSPAGGFYLQRHRSEQQQQPQGSSSAMLSLGPTVMLANASTTDPAKAVAAAAAAAAAAASSMKGGGLPSQGPIHAQFAAVQSAGKPHQHVPASFPYALPAAVQVKPADQKRPAGE